MESIGSRPAHDRTALTGVTVGLVALGVREATAYVTGRFSTLPPGEQAAFAAGVLYASMATIAKARDLKAPPATIDEAIEDVAQNYGGDVERYAVELSQRLLVGVRHGAVEGKEGAQRLLDEVTGS